MSRYMLLMFGRNYLTSISWLPAVCSTHKPTSCRYRTDNYSSITNCFANVYATLAHAIFIWGEKHWSIGDWGGLVNRYRFPISALGHGMWFNLSFVLSCPLSAPGEPTLYWDDCSSMDRAHLSLLGKLWCHVLLQPCFAVQTIQPTPPCSVAVTFNSAQKSLPPETIEWGAK